MSFSPFSGSSAVSNPLQSDRADLQQLAPLAPLNSAPLAFLTVYNECPVSSRPLYTDGADLQPLVPLPSLPPLPQEGTVGFTPHQQLAPLAPLRQLTPFPMPQLSQVSLFQFKTVDQFVSSSFSQHDRVTPVADSFYYHRAFQEALSIPLTRQRERQAALIRVYDEFEVSAQALARTVIDEAYLPSVSFSVSLLRALFFMCGVFFHPLVRVAICGFCWVRALKLCGCCVVGFVLCCVTV
jgi:hypothetical protein